MADATAGGIGMVSVFDDMQLRFMLTWRHHAAVSALARLHHFLAEVVFSVLAREE
jgi:hypothetical protein